MSTKISDRIRSLARDKYVRPAVQKGKVQFTIKVRDLLNDLKADGFPSGHIPQICSALQTTKFLRENGLEIEQVEGPPSKMSPTVVVRYLITKPQQVSGSAVKMGEGISTPLEAESPEARARRLTEKLRGLLKDELAEYGGAEAFIRRVRGYDEEEGA
ncbi:MAG TPA: hypothetical protein VGR47_15400 [Terracidiphilus sp.]|nr:hypothetical protein [Terracidiphilus sp.]